MNIFRVYGLDCVSYVPQTLFYLGKLPQQTSYNICCIFSAGFQDVLCPRSIHIMPSCPLAICNFLAIEPPSKKQLLAANTLTITNRLDLRLLPATSAPFQIWQKMWKQGYFSSSRIATMSGASKTTTAKAVKSHGRLSRQYLQTSLLKQKSKKQSSTRSQRCSGKPLFK